MRGAYIVLTLLLFLSPTFAATLNVNVTSLAPSFNNTNSSVTMLNITLNATGTNTNVSITLNAINISISNASTANFTYVEIRNSTNNVVLGSNTTFNATDNRTTVRFSTALVINSSSNLSLIVAVNTSFGATKLISFSVNVTAASFEANYSAFLEATSNGASGFTQIHSVHENASVTPLYTDTSVVNQSFVYVIKPTGTDAINKTVLNIPIGYTLVNLDSIEHDATNSTTGVTNVTASNQINVTFNTPTTSQIILRFKMNTNSSSKLNLAFNSTLENGNLTNIATDVIGSNTTVNTQQIVNVTSLIAIKNAAYLNGTDYWEFLFSLNFTANVSGRLQFNMSAWNSSSGNILNVNLSNGTYYATIRSSSNFSSPSTINITGEHNISSGIAFNTSSITNSSMYLRMIIPSTVTTVSPSWWAVYTIIFRSDT